VNYENEIFNIKNQNDFEKLAIKIFNYQAKNNKVYSEYIKYLGVNPEKINDIKKIPFLPIEFFKTHKIITGNKSEEIIFTSSGTTGMTSSKHYVTNTELYEKSFSLAFEQFYGNIEEYCIMGLLPSYLERTGSSLIYMVDWLIKKSKHKLSSFYLHNLDDLAKNIELLQSDNQKYILFGVTYALLDFAEKFNIPLNGIVIETGGMKGKRKELPKEAMHQILKDKLKLDNVHSEYGMTELLSQAYSLGNTVFQTPPWMKILIRDIYDPFAYVENNISGGINVIDLANINSCSFIETKDLGKKFDNNTFTVLGRFDNSDIRGCNLLVQ